MHPLAGISIAAFVIILYAYAKITGRRRGMLTAERAARTLGLAEDRAGSRGLRAFTGNIGGRRVGLKKLPDRLEVHIEITAGMPDDMRIVGVSRSADTIKSPRDCDIISGDETFNAWFSLRTSDAAAALAFLDADTRKTIIRLYQPASRIEVTSRSLVLAYDTMRTPYHNKWALVKTVRDVIKSVKSLEGRFQVKDRLIAILGTDPYPFIRLAAMRSAAVRFPADPGVLAAIEKSLSDPSLPVMFEAVRILREKGTAFLLDHLLNGKGLHYKTAIDIIEAIAEGPTVKGAADVLEKAFMMKRRPAVRMALLTALTRLADAAAGPFLNEQLDRFDSDLRRGIILALGTCGNVESVSKLHAVLKETINPFLRRDIENAIASIQSRLGADRGWLSAGESVELDGALSAGTGEGALSLGRKKE